MEPFRELLKNPGGKVVYWVAQLEALFTSAKDTIRQLTGMSLRSGCYAALPGGNLCSVAADI